MACYVETCILCCVPLFSIRSLSLSINCYNSICIWTNCNPYKRKKHTRVFICYGLQHLELNNAMLEAL